MRKSAWLFSLVVLVLFAWSATGFAMQGDKAWESSVITKAENGQKMTEQEQAWWDARNPGTNELDQTGGPDAFGYVYTDSNEPDGPTYGWIDITGTGTMVDPGPSDDGEVGPFAIGFDFPFYGATNTEFYVAGNGMITFSAGNTSLSNQDIPNASSPNNLIGWMWDDMNFGDTDVESSIYYEMMNDGSNDYLVISLIGYTEYGASGAEDYVTAQVLMYDDGRIVLQYDIVGETFDVNSATIGIENADGSVGLSWCYNNGDLLPADFDDLVIEFSLLAADASISGTVTDAGTEAPIEGATVTVGPYTTTSGVDGTYSIADVFSASYDVSAAATGYFTYNAEAVEVVAGANTIDISMDAFPAVTVGDDFESGSDNWVVNTNLESPMWQYGVPDFVDGPAEAHSVTNLFGTNLVEDYVASTDDTLTLVDSFVPIAPSMFAYWEWMYTESGWDGYNVEASTDGGATWEIIDPFLPGAYNDADVDGIGNDVRGFSGNNSEWRYVAFDLSAFDGMETMIRFVFGSDGSGQYPGVYIDDVELRSVGAMPMFSGTVTNASTEAPIEGAEVVVSVDGTEEVVATLATDAAGFYSTTVAPGEYNINVTAPGFDAGFAGPQIVAYGDAFTFDFALEPGTDEVDFTGTVMSADTPDTPVAGVAVTIVGAGQTAITDASGNFSFTGVVASTYNFYMTHNPVGSMGYHDATMQVEVATGMDPVELMMPEILAPTINTVVSMDGGVSVDFDPPANHAEPPALIRGIEFRQNTLERLGDATDAKSVRVRNEMTNELVVLQRRLDAIQNNSLDDIADLVGYRFMLNGELLADVAEGSPYMVTGLNNGTLYQVQVAADYDYNEMYLEWSEASPAYPTPSGLYAVEETDYTWLDIRPSEDGSGTALNLTDDGESPLLPMPDGWSFTHYGVGYSEFSVSPNGWVSFIHDNGGLSGTIPSTSTPNATVAPYWRDQDPGDSDTEDAWYWFDEENELVYIQWHVGNYPGPANNEKDYQVVLDPATSTSYMYYNTSATGWSGDTGVTIGVENAEGTVGLTYPHASIVDGHGIMFFPLQIDYGTLDGIVTDATTDSPVEGAIVNAVSATGAEYSGISDANGHYEVRLVDQTDGPWDLTFRATGYEDGALDAVDFVEGDGYVHSEDIALNPIDPTTPPNIISADGTSDVGVSLTLSEPGSLVESDYLQLDDGTINDATGWNPGYTVDYWFAAKFTAPGENVVVAASDIRYLVFDDFDQWWPAGDESHQPVVIGVFNDNAGVPGELVWTSAEMTPSEEDPTVEVAPGVAVTSTFYIGFYNVTPEAGQEPVCLDGTNDHSALYLSTNGGDTWTNSTSGDPLIRASVLYSPTGGAPMAAVLTPTPVNAEKQVDQTITLSSQLPVWGLQGSSFEAPHPYFGTDNELDEFVGFNVEYSANGTDWTQANDELIEGNFYFVTLGSENEGTEYSFRANAVVTDPEGGDDITSNYSDVTLATYGMAPAAPADLAATNDGLVVDLTWTAPDVNADGSELVDLAGYNVYMVSGAEPVMLGTTETTSYQATMDSEGFYAFAVTAYDEVPNESGMSEALLLLVGDPGLATSFEDGEWNEMESDGVWAHGMPTAGPGTAHTGDNAWSTGLTGNYDNSQNNYVQMTVPFQVSSDGALAAYWHWLDYENSWDGYNVWISTDEGASWEVIDPVGGYPDDSIVGMPNGEPGFTDDANTWQLVMFPLGAYNGSTIMLRWFHGTDGSVNSYTGVTFDDLELYGVVPPAYGMVTGVLHDCADDGPPVIGAEIWADGHMMGVSSADGSFAVEMLAGLHTIEFHHDNFWTLSYEDQDVPADGEMDMGDMVMVKPVPAVDPTTLSMDININDTDPVSSSFELANDGCGSMEFTASVNILNGANEIVGSYPENVRPSDITEVADLPYYQTSKQSAVERGPVAVSELDETWDLLDTFDADAISGAQDNLSAWIDGTSGYIMQFNAPYSIYEFDFSGNLLETHTPSTGGTQWWNEIEYDPTTGLVMTAAANGAIYQFMPDGSNATNIGTVGQDAWGLAYDYDNGIVYWANAYEQSAWGMLNLSTSQNTALGEPAPGGYPYAMMYVPNDPNGNTIYGAFSASPTAGPVGIYGYNPTTMAWTSTPIVTLYGDGSYGVVGMTGTHDWSGGLDFVLFGQGTGIADMVDIYEGMTLQSWLYVDPGTGILLPGESANITVTVDLAADPGFNPVDGQNVTAQVVITGPHMADTAVTVDMIFLDTSVEEDVLPMQYALHQNYPNPFNPSTAIKFDLVATQNVKLAVYNMLGQEVARLVDGQMQAGYHNVSFDASRLASGVYFYRLETPGFTKMRKMVLVK
ncbi:carboxypeptidase regulatory-like domain-containing protein [bacterium]|nr:carboxypeptidase regulatory-like domain-containing protein [bacterium]